MSHCYVAKHPGIPGYYAACVDHPEHKEDTAKSVAEWIKEGSEVSRVSSEETREGLHEYFNYKRAQPHQLELSENP